jgi:hypothetical protein
MDKGLTWFIKLRIGLVAILALAPWQALAAGAAYPFQGREPIEVLADQTRDAIAEKLTETCRESSCFDTVPSRVEDIRQGCLRDTLARHPHGIGGENDLIACMARRSHLPEADSAPDNAVEAGRAPDESSDFRTDATADGALPTQSDPVARSIVRCEERDGAVEMRERGGCLAAGGRTVERVQ